MQPSVPAQPPQSIYPPEAYQAVTPAAPYYPYPQPVRLERGRVRWIVVVGGLLAFVGAVVVAVVYFWLASVDPSTINSFDSVRWTYQVEGAGTILTGIGFMIAFIGLAIRS